MRRLLHPRLALPALLVPLLAASSSVTATPARAADPSPGTCPSLTLEGDPDEAGNTATRVGTPLTLVARSSDPSSTYRLEVTSPYVGPVRSGEGAETRWEVSPSENTDVRVRSTVRGQYDCLSNPLHLYVEPAISISAERLGTRRDVFRGRVLPGRHQLVTLYRLSDRGPVITAQSTVRDDGTYAIDRTFTTAGRYDFVVGVGRSSTNLAGRSPVRETLVY